MVSGPRPVEDHLGLADLQLRLSRASLVACEHRPALHAAQEARRHLEAAGDQQRLGEALIQVAFCSSAMGDPASANEAALEAIRVLSPLGDTRDLASAYAALAREALQDCRLTDVNHADVRLDDFAKGSRLHVTRSDRDHHLRGAGPLREPRGGDTRPVSRHLGDRSVRVPDDHVGSRAGDGQDLENAIRADPGYDVTESPYAFGSQRTAVRSLDDEVAIAERMPFRESHLPPHPRADTR